MESNAGMVSMFGGDRTMIMGGNFTQITQPAEQRDARKTLAQSIAKGARHNSTERYDAPKCHPNTRVAIIEEIMDWINSPLNSNQPKIKWLNGAAGAGKSAIMQTVAMFCNEVDILGGSFFFKRSDHQRGVAERLISTLAYQLCDTFPAIRPNIEDGVNRDPTFLSLLLSTQFTNLILNPLRAKFDELKKPVVLVIDGLDECNDRQAQEHIINLLVEMANCSTSPPIPFRFLIASRRESHIVSAFSLALASASTPPFTEINLIHDRDVNNDIRLYMNAKFEVIRRKRDIPLGWPTEYDLDHILKLSSGQFIFSSTVISHVDSDDHHPHVRLQQILQRIPYSTDETPFASLDALYSHILSELPQSHLATVKKILPIYLNERVSRVWDEVHLRRTITEGVPPQCPCGSRVHCQDVRTIERVLGLPEGDIKLSLRRLSAVVSCEYSDKIRGYDIQVHHASLGDFLNAEDRAGRFFLGDHHTQIQNSIGRVLSAALHPFLKDDTSIDDIHDTRFDHTKCQCGTDVQHHRTIILLKHFTERLSPEWPPLRHSDTQLFSQIDFAKVFDGNSPINPTYRSKHISYIATYLQIDPLQKPVLLALNNFLSGQLLSNYCPTLSHDYQDGDILQLVMNFKDLYLVYKKVLPVSPPPFQEDLLLVEQVVYAAPDMEFYYGYATLLSSAQVITAAHPPWSPIVSDPTYQLKLFTLFLWTVADGLRSVLLEYHSLTKLYLRRFTIESARCSFYHANRGLGRLLPKSAFSPEITLLLRVMRCCNTVVEREAQRTLLEDNGMFSVFWKTDDEIEDYLSRHKYCDETCRKARHDTLIEQIDRAWKDWNEDLKRHGPRCTQVIIPPLKALFYIIQLLKFTSILHDLMHILAVYHIISNPDMIIYDLARHVVPIVNFAIIARVWLRY